MNISNQQEKRGVNTCILISSTSFNLPTQQQQANTVTPTSHNLPNNNDTCMINTHLSHQTGKPTEPDGEHRYDRPPDLPKVNDDTTSDGDGEISSPPHGGLPTSTCTHDSYQLHDSNHIVDGEQHDHYPGGSNTSPATSYKVNGLLTGYESTPSCPTHDESTSTYNFLITPTLKLSVIPYLM